MSTEMDEQASPLERDHLLCVVLPGGLEKKATVHGSQPVMDLLVTLCASYHLNPSDYTVEVLSPNKNNISFKPNSPIGLLEAEKIVLKPKGTEEKVRRPYMPEATVRLLINYNKSHKTVVRVNPRLPLEMLLPVVCDKCEFKVETTVLLRDPRSEEQLDLSRTLDDHGLREVFAKDTASKHPADSQQPLKAVEAAVAPAVVISPPPPQDLPKKEKKRKENAGFLSLFRRKNKHGVNGAANAAASPGLSKQAGGGVSPEDVSSTNTLPADVPKKRRAPQPPMGASQSVPNNLGGCHLRGAQRSAESTLRSTKRRAPAPPRANALQELQVDADVRGSLNTVEELGESDESGSLHLSPHPSHPQSSSSRPALAHLHEVADPYLSSLRGKDLSDARHALAKVLTSSISKGTLVKRLRNSTFPKFHNGSYSTSPTPRCQDNEGFCTELESVLRFSLPTQSEWENPEQRTGLSTFKVVPPSKPDLTPHVPDQRQVSVEDNPRSEASPEVQSHQTETDEPPRCPDSPESETAFPSPEASSQQVQASDGSASPSLLHGIESQSGPHSPLPEVGDGAENHQEEPEVASEEPEVASEEPEVASEEPEVASEEPVVASEEPVVASEEPVVASEEIPAAPADCSDGHINSEGSRDSIQSPSGDMDPCSLRADEKEVVDEAEDEDEDEDEDSFPPPPPPVFFNEDLVVMGSELDGTALSLPPSQSTPTSSGQTQQGGSDLPKEPLDKTSPAPSRFAQAVATAIQRSRLQSLSKSLGGPQVSSGPSTTPRSTYQYGA